MISRLALAVSFMALVAAAAGFIVLGSKVSRLNRRIAGIENRTAPPAPPKPEAPRDSEPTRESRQELEKTKVRKLAEMENRENLDKLAQKLDLDADSEAKLREAFTEEFSYYTEGLLKAFKAMREGGSEEEQSWLTSTEFRRGLEDRIAAADMRVNALLSGDRRSTYETWRRELRKDRYELE